MSSAIVSSADHEEEIMRRMESLHAAIRLPADSFLKAALSLKDKVLDATWTAGTAPCVDPTAYVGLLGTAILCLRSYEATGSAGDLRLGAEIVDKCAVAAWNCNRHVTFLCGRAGVYALGAVLAHYTGDRQRQVLFLDLFLEVAQERALSVGPEEGGFGMSYDLLHGRAGFLFSTLFINKHLGPNTIPPELLNSILQSVLSSGRTGSTDNLDRPLMYRWHGTRYLGAAHGLAGIIQVLLHFQLGEQDREDVKETVRYMIRNRFKQSGNFPSSEGNTRDKLVHWSHGAGGVTIMLCKSAQVFENDKESPYFSQNNEFHEAAVQAGEVVWNRGLNKKIGLADGIAGNVYTFLSLYRLTGDELYLRRAEAFSSVLYETLPKTVSDGTENGYSLFHGLAGVACLWFDLASPDKARFPGFEI